MHHTRKYFFPRILVIVGIVVIFVSCEECLNFIEKQDSIVSLYYWNDTYNIKDQIAYIIKRQCPVKIIGAPLDNWKAFSNWKDTEYLERNIPIFVDVRSKPPGQAFINVEFSSASNLAMDLGLFKEPTEFLQNLTSTEFLNTKVSSRYYARELFNDDLASLVPDIQPIDFLDIKETKKNPGIFLWMAHEYTRAVFHYDTAHNLNVQIVGKKRFWLSPAKNWHIMMLHPSFHFSRRQSQLKDHSIFNHSVVLEPKQILYIPPYYFHAVEAMDFCANVNVFSTSKIRAIEKQISKTIYFHPPILDEILDVNPSMYVQAVVYLLTTVIAKALNSRKMICEDSPVHVDPFKILNVILHHRFSRFTELSCENFVASQCPRDLYIVPLVKNYQQELDLVATSVTNIVEKRDICWNEGVLEIILSDWIEAVLSFSIGLKKSCTFLSCILNMLHAQERYE